jgi:hypothetical protein
MWQSYHGEITEKQETISSRRNDILPSIETRGNGRKPVGKKRPPSETDLWIRCAAAGRHTRVGHHTPRAHLHAAALALAATAQHRRM